MFGDITSGAANDIQQATRLARKMVCEWGMSERLGAVALGHKEELVFLGRDLGEQRNYSEEVASIIDEEIRSIITQAYNTAKRILTEKKDKLIEIAEYLKQVETISADEFNRMLGMPLQEVPAEEEQAVTEA
jgi:cell division protease FtsH